jgi:hypothetical protein
MQLGFDDAQVGELDCEPIAALEVSMPWQAQTGARRRTGSIHSRIPMIAWIPAMRARDFRSF